MLKNKAFTLVELIAVIVILAIIFLITTPLITNIIKDSRDKTADETLLQVKKAISLYVDTTDLDNENHLPVTITFENSKMYYQFNGQEKIEGNLLNLKNKIPESGKIVINTDKSYKYYIYDSYRNKCIENNDTNYFNLNPNLEEIHVNEFNDGLAVVNVGVLDVKSGDSDLKIENGQYLQVDYDILYEDVIHYNENEELPEIYLVGNTNSITLPKITINGTGVYHFSTYYKLENAENNYNMSMHFNHIESGNIEISNIRITKKDNEITKNGECQIND